MIVREVLPPDSTAAPREERVGMVIQALGIPWLAEKAAGSHLEIGSGGGIYINGALVAQIIAEPTGRLGLPDLAPGRGSFGGPGA